MLHASLWCCVFFDGVWLVELYVQIQEIGLRACMSIGLSIHVPSSM